MHVTRSYNASRCAQPLSKRQKGGKPKKVRAKAKVGGKAKVKAGGVKKTTVRSQIKASKDSVGKKRKAGGAKGESPEPEAEETEMIPAIEGMFDVGGTNYVADEAQAYSQPEKGNRVLYFIRKPAKDRGFYTAVVTSVNKGDGAIWVKFDSDGKPGKLPDMTDEFYQKRWCFVKVAQESQEEEGGNDEEAAATTEPTE